MRFLLLLACGCNLMGSTATAVVAPDSGVDAPTPVPTEKAGDRLKVRVEHGDDGSTHVLDARYDSKLKEKCEDACASDGKLRCLPGNAAILDNYYADKDCTQRLGAGIKGQPLPPHARLESKEPMTGTAYWCEYKTQVRIFKVDGEYRESYVYLKDNKSGGCSKVTSKEDSSLDEFGRHMVFFSVSTEVSPSEFVLMNSTAEGLP